MPSDWDAIAPQWDENRTSPTKTLAFFTSYAKGTVLDAGCGNGRNSRELAKTADHVTALDASDAMVNIAEKNLGDLKNVDVIHAKIEKIPLENGSFDAIFCLAALHHLKPEDQPKAAAEFFRVLKPGGHLCMTVWNRRQKRFQNKPKELNVPWKGKRRYYYFFDEAELTRGLEAARFLVEKIIYEKNGFNIQAGEAQNLCILAVKK